MVRIFRVAARDCHQCCRGVFHHDLRAEIWEGTLDKLADIDGGLLFSERPRHSATKGTARQDLTPKLRLLTFHKLLILSPQVVFLAIFFALVIKKVDADDYQHMVVAKSKSNPGKRL